MSKPTKTPSAPSPGELAEFAPKARRYRRRFRIGLTGVLIGLLGGMVFVRGWPWAFPIGWTLGLLFMLFTAMTWNFLPACPGCHGDIGRQFGKFCRECGRALVVDSESKIHLLCPTGAHAFFNSEGKYRRGRIRHCPCCGLFLDEHGL